MAKLRRTRLGLLGKLSSPEGLPFPSLGLWGNESCTTLGCVQRSS